MADEEFEYGESTFDTLVVNLDDQEVQQQASVPSGYEDNIHEYIRIGEITTVNKKEGTCSVRFLDSQGGRDRVVVSMPISNDSGMFWMPVATETAVILGRRPGGIYEILAYLPRGYNNLVQFGEHLQLEQGEFILRSKGGATICGTNDGSLTFYDGKMNKVIMDSSGNFSLRMANGALLSSSNTEVYLGKLGSSSSATSGMLFPDFIKLMTTDGFRVRAKGFSATNIPVDAFNIDPTKVVTQMELTMKVENFMPSFSLTVPDVLNPLNLLGLFSLSITAGIVPTPIVANMVNMIIRSNSVVIGKNDPVSMAIPDALLVSTAVPVAKSGDAVIPSATMLTWMAAVTLAAKCPVPPPVDPILGIGNILNTTSNLKVQI